VWMWQVTCLSPVDHSEDTGGWQGLPVMSSCHPCRFHSLLSLLLHYMYVILLYFANLLVLFCFLDFNSFLYAPVSISFATGIYLYRVLRYSHTFPMMHASFPFWGRGSWTGNRCMAGLADTFMLQSRPTCTSMILGLPPWYYSNLK
jgi:hypothetical protein